MTSPLPSPKRERSSAEAQITRTHDTHARGEIEPPTVEQWQRLGPASRLYIFALVFCYTWESWLSEIGLKIGGLR